MAFIEENDALVPTPTSSRTPGWSATSPDRYVSPAVQAQRDADAGRLLVAEYPSVEAARASSAALRRELPKVKGDARGMLSGHLERLDRGLAESPVTPIEAAPRTVKPAEQASQSGFITEGEALGSFISEEEATGIRPKTSTWERVKEDVGAMLGIKGPVTAGSIAQRGYDWLTKPTLDESNSSVFERGQKMTPPTKAEYAAAAPIRERVGALPKPTLQSDRPTGAQVIARGAAGVVPQLSDMLTSTGKQVLTLPIYAAGYAYQRSQGVDSPTAAKLAMQNKDKLLPDEIFAPWRTIAENLGGEVKAAYEKNPVAWVMGQIGEVVTSGGEAAASKLNVPPEHFAAITDEVMGLMGVHAFKPAVAKAIAARLEQMTGVSGRPGMGGFGGFAEAPRERVTPDMSAPQVKAIVDSALAGRGPLETIWPPEPPKVKTKAAKVTPMTEMARTLTEESPYVEPAAVRRTPGEFGPEPVQGPPAPVRPEPLPAERPLILSGLEKQQEGLLVSAAEAKALRRSGLDAKTTAPLVTEALNKLREGQLISVEQARALRSLKVDVERGVVKGPTGETLFERGKADPALLGVLSVLGLGAAMAPQLVDWWNNSGGLSGDNARDVALGPGAAGAAGVMKPKGGMWKPDAVRRLGNSLFPGARTDRAFYESLPEPLRDQKAINALAAAQQDIDWADQAITKYLNRYAGTAADPIKDLKLPDGRRFEELTDLAFGSTTAEMASRTGMAQLDPLIAEGKISPAEPIYKLGGVIFPKQVGHAAGDVGSAVRHFTDYLAHVGDWIRAQNFTPEQLARLDLPRAIRETVLNDERIQKLAYEEYTKPNPDKIANNDALPTYKTYAPKQEPARQFSFKNDKSTTNSETKAIELKPEEITYSWKEIARPDSLTPEQAKRVRPNTGSLMSAVAPHVYEAIDAKGNPIKENFSGQLALGDTPQDAYLAGELAREGNAMAHCVGGYCAQVLSGASKIYSLRDQLGRSYATVEVKPAPFVDEATRKRDFREKVLNHPRSEITQIYGPGNGAPAKYVQPYIADFVKTGNWGDVANLDHAGLRDVSGEPFSPAQKAHFKKTVGTDRYVDQQTFDKWYEGRGWLEQGKADPKLLAGIAAGTAAALYLANNPIDDFTKAALALVGTVGVTKGRFADMPLPEVIKTYRESSGRSKELAAAKIYEDTHRQLTRSVQQMVKDQNLPVEDIVQETYMSAFKALDAGAYDGTRAALPTFLHAIAKNELRQMYRRPVEQTARRTGSLEVDPETQAAVVPEKYLMEQNPERYKSAYDEAAQTDLGSELERAFQKLPEDQQAAFKAIEMDAMSYAEAAEMFGIPEGTVKSQVNRAKAGMQRFLSIYSDRQAGKATVKDMMRVAAVAGGAALGAVYADDPQKGAIVGGLVGLGGALLGTGPAGLALKRSTTKLAEIYPPLRRAARDLEHSAAVEIAAASNTISDFIKPALKLSKAQYAALDKAYSEADPQALAEVIKGHPELVAGYENLRKMLDAAGERLVAEGRFKEGIPDYLPLMVKDYKGLMESLGRPVQEGLKDVLHKAELKSQKKYGRPLTEVERSAVTSRYLLQEPSTSYLPAFAKARRLRMTEETRPFYHTMEHALLHYVHGMVSDLATTKFFDRDLVTSKVKGQKFTNVEGSISQLTNRALDEGKITPEQAVELQQVLRARFIGGEKSPSPWLQDVRNVSGIGLLGQLGSGVVQTSEALLSAYHHGVFPALKAAGTLLTGKGIKPAEFGLANHVIEEVVGQRRSGKALSLVLKANLLAAFDQLGMKQNLTASFYKNKRLAETPGGRAKLAEKWGDDYGPDLPQVIQELQQSTVGNRTPLVESLLYQELSDIRPTSRMEAPVQFNAHPNVRIFYHLQQFMLTQADILYRDAYKKIVSGNPRQMAVGFKNLALYGSALALASVPADAIKDWMMGRELKLDKIDYVDNFIRNFGLSRYSLDTVEDSKVPGKTALGEVKKKLVPPAFSVAERLVEGLSDPRKLVPLVPLGGRIAYNRAFGGNEEAEISQIRRENRKLLEERKKLNPSAKLAPGEKKPLSPAAQQYLREKKLKEKQKQLERNAP